MYTSKYLFTCIFTITFFDIGFTFTFFDIGFTITFFDIGIYLLDLNILIFTGPLAMSFFDMNVPLPIYSHVNDNICEQGFCTLLS